MPLPPKWALGSWVGPASGRAEVVMVTAAEGVVGWILGTTEVSELSVMDAAMVP